MYHFDVTKTDDYSTGTDYGSLYGKSALCGSKVKRKNTKVKCKEGIRDEKLQGELKSFPRRLYFGKFC